MKISIAFAIVVFFLSFMISSAIDLIIKDRIVEIEDNLTIAVVLAVSVFVIDLAVNKGNN